MLNSRAPGTRNPVLTLRTYEVFCKSTAVAEILELFLEFHSRPWFMSKHKKHKSLKASKPKVSKPQYYPFYKTALFQQKHRTPQRKSGPQMEVIRYYRVTLGTNQWPDQGSLPAVWRSLNIYASYTQSSLSIPLFWSFVHLVFFSKTLSNSILCSLPGKRRDGSG